MKKINILFLLLVLLGGIQLTGFGQESQTKIKTISVLTNAVCEECKEIIEKELNYTKGIIYSELNLETKKVTVKYKTKLLSRQKIERIIANLGYDAGETPRNKVAFENLPVCCKSKGHCKD